MPIGVRGPGPPGAASGGWSEAVALAAFFLSASTSTAPVDALSHSARYCGHPLSLFGLPVLVKQPLMVFNLLRLLAWQNIMTVPLTRAGTV